MFGSDMDVLLVDADQPQNVRETTPKKLLPDNFIWDVSRPRIETNFPFVLLAIQILCRLRKFLNRRFPWD